MQVWCGGRVLRGGDEDPGPPPSTRPSSLSGDLHPPRHQHSTAQQGTSLPSEAHTGTARPLVQCLDRCTSHHLAAGAGAGLGSGHWPAAVHWRCTAQPRHCHEVTCTGWIYACPVLVMKASEVDTNFSWFLTTYTFFIPLLPGETKFEHSVIPCHM